MPPDRHETQPSAEIVRVERAKCRRECDLSRSVATLCGDRARRAREMQARVRFGFVAQPSAEIVRVECAKCRRECDLSRSGDNPLRRSCVSRCAKCRRECDLSLSGQPSAEIVRVEMREMQARVRFVPFCPGNPLRDRACENAGESAICPGRGQPSAEIVRVGCAKCRRECDLVLSGQPSAEIVRVGSAK